MTRGGDAGGARRGATRPTFDPGDADHFAAAASPVLRGLPAGSWVGSVTMRLVTRKDQYSALAPHAPCWR